MSQRGREGAPMPQSAAAPLLTGLHLQISQMWVAPSLFLQPVHRSHIRHVFALRYLSPLLLCGRDCTVLAWDFSSFLSCIIWVGSASFYIAGALHTPFGWGLWFVAFFFSHHGTLYSKRKGLERRWSLPEGQILHDCRMTSSGIKDHYQILGKPMGAVSQYKLEQDRTGHYFNMGPKEWIIRN